MSYLFVVGHIDLCGVREARVIEMVLPRMLSLLQNIQQLVCQTNISLVWQRCPPSDLWAVMVLAEVQLSKAVGNVHLLLMNGDLTPSPCCQTLRRTEALKTIVFKSSKNILFIFMLPFIELFVQRCNSMTNGFRFNSFDMLSFTVVACLCWTNSLPKGDQLREN